MLKKISKSVFSLALLGIVLPMSLLSQGDESFRIKLESILYSYKNYRFSMVSVYKLKDIKDVRKLIQERDAIALGAASGVIKTEGDPTKGVDATTLQVIEREAKNGSTLMAVQRALAARSLPIPENVDAIFQYYAPTSGPERKITNVYVVTTRKTPDAIMPHNLQA